MNVCIFVKLHVTAQSGRASESFDVTRIDPPKWGSMILVTKTSDQMRQRMYVVCMDVVVFIKLHITAQSGPVILVVLCHSH